MASLRPAEDWTQRELVPLKSARRSFIAPGYATASAAINAVCGNFGVRPGNSHPDDPNLIVSLGGISARNKDGATTWQIDIGYEYITFSAATQGQDKPPLQRDTIWTFQPGIDSVQIDHDSYGQALLSSSQTPLQPYSLNVNTLCMTAVRFYAKFDGRLALKFMNAVNASPIYLPTLGLVPAKCVKINRLYPTQPFTLRNVQPVEVGHEFEVRGSLITNDPNDPAFAAKYLDSSRSGWYSSNDVIDAKQPGDFSSIDTVGQYRYRNDDTLLDGSGRPISGDIKIGERQPKDPVAVECNPKAKRIFNEDKSACFLLYDVCRTIEFAPLMAGLN